jgi:glycosyl transferase family 25
MEYIDAILYINLPYRTDRKEHLLGELNKWNVSASRIHQIEAIQRNPGALGCGLSHIKALTYALSHPEWNTVLVLEDDFTFHSYATDEQIRQFVVNDATFDVALLSYNPEYIKYNDTTNTSIKKVLYSQTTSSYMIRKHYIPTLLQNMKESMYDMERYGKQHENCVDIYWTRLQPAGNWFAFFPALGYQYDNYSDIEHRITSYGC